MSEPQDHRPPWRVSDERVRILCEEEEKLHSPWLTDSPLIRDEVELAIDLRDARARIEELEEQLALGARMEAHLAEKLDHADTALLHAMDRIKELEATVLRMKGMVALAEGAEQMSTERIVELEAALLPFAEMEDDDLPVGEQYRAKFIRARRVMSEGE